jgi:hypothetical protein
VLIVHLVCVSQAHTSWRLNDPRFALVRFYSSAYRDLRSAVVLCRRVDELGDYVMQSDDPVLLKWWAAYLESIERYGILAVSLPIQPPAACCQLPMSLPCRPVREILSSRTRKLSSARTEL